MTANECWLLSYLLNSLWQIPLLFAAGWLIARTLKPLGPAVEHRLWVGVLFFQTLLPVASALPSQTYALLWARFSVLFTFFGHAPRSSDPHVSIIMGAGTGLTVLHLPPSMLTTVAIAYAVVTVYFAARFLWRCHHLRALRRESEPVTLRGEAARCWQQCCERFAIDNVSLATSTSILGPVTIGLTRKLLLLPETMVAALPDTELRTVIAHEFAHMRRNDFLKNLIYETLALPASYHPALRLTRDRIMETREIVCDQMAAPIDGRNEYARSLLRLAALLVSGMPIRTPHAIGIFDANAFERRLMKLTLKPTEVRGPRRVAILAACAALGLTTCVSALGLRLPVNMLPGGTDKNASQPPTRLTVPASVMASNVISKKAPIYPGEAKEQRIQGTVKLNAVINKEGNVENLVALSGPKELQKSALDAVREWTYKPYLLNGEPIEVETTVSVVYSLSK